jgi:hypothetical protein
MVRIETIDLSSRNVEFPEDRVGMVIAQPFLSLSEVEPYRCTEEAKPRQIAGIARTLEISLLAHHNAEKTHFTIFPEYSICGVDGVQIIQNAMTAAGWPCETVVIGGTDALTKAEFTGLCGEANTHVDTNANNLNRVEANEWVNCKITWVKGRSGTVERWLQPKIAPALPEEDVSYQRMFRGGSIYTFKGKLRNQAPFRFCSLICFDWIALVGNKKIWKWVLEDLNREATEAGAQFPLTWFFVIQRNPRPSHNTFLSEVGSFFDQTTLPNIRRTQTCLLFSNGAGNPSLGKAAQYGQTSLVLLPQNAFEAPTCSMTFSNGGPRFRDNSTLLQGYNDVFFREKGACIHSFAQINPDSCPPGPAGRTIALHNAAVFPFSETTDRRAPSSPVPAVTKWWNDELDTLPKLSVAYAHLPFAQDLETNHDRNVSILRAVEGQPAWNAVKLAAQLSEAETPDQFAQTELQALENLLNTLNIISLGSAAPVVRADAAHATVALRDQPVELIAILGRSHEDCWKHCQNIVPKPRRDLLIVSRDPDNTRLSNRSGSFLTPRATRLGEERKITDPSTGILRIGYSNLLETIRTQTTVAEVHGAIDAELAA